MTHRQEAMGQERYAGLTVLSPNGDRHFNGVVRCHEDMLDKPLHWRKPRRIFVNSMADLFHKGVPFEFVDRVFAVMALCPQHIFQILTKRPERMAEYFRTFDDEDEIDGVCGLMRLGHAAGKMLDGVWVWGKGKRHRTAIDHLISDAYEEDDEDSGYEAKELPWPLPNVHLGTSCEDQTTADARIPHLLRCPGTLFLSLEPLLGPIQLPTLPRITGTHPEIHQVILGGESGPKARPMHPDWARSVRDQCDAAGVPFFFKQWGQWESDPLGEVVVMPDGGRFEMLQVEADRVRAIGNGGVAVRKVGKKNAGRLLDGVEHSEHPKWEV